MTGQSVRTPFVPRRRLRYSRRRERGSVHGRDSNVKTLLKVVGIAVGGLVLVCAVVVAGSLWIFGPVGPVPGPELSGPLVTEPVDDWSFVDAIDTIQLETRPEDPYSVNIWLTRVGDAVYVFAGSDQSNWIQNIAAEPRVRLRIDGRIYQRRAVGVEDLETKRAVLTSMKAKYEGDIGYDADFVQRGMETGDFFAFRMDPR
jgi:hypothetical protein